MITIEVNLYQFEELSTEAKEKAGGHVVLAWKKTKRKNNSKVRVADGERTVYIVDEELMFKLLESYKGEW